MKRYACLLVVLLLLPAAGWAEEKMYPVPNPENAYQVLGTDAPLLAVKAMGRASAGDLTGNAYAVSYVGPADSVWAQRWRDIPRSLLDAGFVQLQWTDGVETKWQEVTVNGTDAALYTYPNGGRVLFAWAIPEIAPLLIVEADCGLYLADAGAAASTAAPSPTPSPAPTQRPRTGGTGVSFDWKNSDPARQVNSVFSNIDWNIQPGDTQSSAFSNIDWSILPGDTQSTLDAATGSGTAGSARCITCHGTGECRLCHGKGKEEVFWRSGWGIVKSTDPESIRFRDCQMCGGTGKCPYCQ